VRKGAGDPGYLGAAVGGGIEIERTEPGPGFQLNASADSGSYGSNVGRLDFGGRAGWFGGYVVGSWSESNKIDANSDGWADLPADERYTVETGLDLTPGESHRVRVGAMRYVEDQVDGPAAAVGFSRATCTGLEQVIFQSAPCAQTEGVAYNREDVQLERDQAEARYDLSLGSGTTLSLAGMFGRRNQEIQETDLPRNSLVNVLSEEDLQYIEDNFGLTPEQLAELGFDFVVGGAPAAAEPPRFAAYTIDDDNRHGSLVLAQAIGQQATLRIGASSTGTTFDVADYRLNKERNEIQDANYPLDQRLEEELVETGYWVEGDTAIGSRVELSAGVRHVDYRYSDNEEEINERVNGLREPWLGVPLPEGDRWVPRATLTWKATDDLQLRLSAGEGLRAPAPAFDKVCCGRQYRGNRGILLEESRSLGLEITHQTGPRWRLGGSWFVTDFDNLIINMATGSSQWSHVYQNVNIASARNTAVSVEGRFQAPTWLTTSVSYTWLDAANRSADGTITALFEETAASGPVPRTFAYDGIPYTTEERGAVGLAFRLPAQVMLTVAAQYTGPTLIQRFHEDKQDPSDSGIDPARDRAVLAHELESRQGVRERARGLRRRRQPVRLRPGRRLHVRAGAGRRSEPVQAG